MQESDHANNTAVQDLCQTLLLLQTEDEAHKFLRDLCTPKEITALAERWRVCRLLERGEHSYRDISGVTGASLTTISRVARFLKDEPYQGYRLLLSRLNKQS
jgi:TrpR-related protein YerC/YecD